ncbi:Hypothetical predicted protein [Mytilus galloprovincialis]|uniref:Uncharacterized protein n=1 Tax=Mytilus galloprovincialis TaxID=29158 RepID=A0A8B6GH29_MYTGA|nr:Hypothetical predicted protein [Mytilus galloprovincialis]
MSQSQNPIVVDSSRSESDNGRYPCASDHSSSQNSPLILRLKPELRHKLRKLQQKVKRGAETESDSDGLVFDISPYKAPVKKPAKRKLPVTTVEQLQQPALNTPVTPTESKGTQTVV